MRDGNSGPAMAGGIKSGLDGGFGLRVEGGGRLVEETDKVAKLEKSVTKMERSPIQNLWLAD